VISLCLLNLSLNDKHGVISCRILRKRMAVGRTENPRVGGSIPPLATTLIESPAYERSRRQGGRETVGLLIRSSNSTARFARGAIPGFPLVCRDIE
jgi:hypothetical protein